jgi:hypothetical protein
METTERYNVGLKGNETAHEVFDAICKAKLPQNREDWLLRLAGLVIAAYEQGETEYEGAFWVLQYYAEIAGVDLLGKRLTALLKKADAISDTSLLPANKKLVTYMYRNPWVTLRNIKPILFPNELEERLCLGLRVLKPDEVALDKDVFRRLLVAAAPSQEPQRSEYLWTLAHHGWKAAIGDEVIALDSLPDEELEEYNFLRR